MTRILVIIISFNSEKWIRKNLNSLLSQNIVVDILLIDNNSQDLTLSIVKQEYPQIRVIELKENIGFARANNIGFEIAKSEHFEYVFLLNHDAWLAKNCLKELLDCSEKNNSDILSPMHMNGQMLDFDFGFKRYIESHYNELKNSDTKYFEVEKINAAFMMMKTDVLYRLNGFDPLFYFYGEDEDFCSRAKSQGFKIVVVKNSLAYHDRQERPYEFSREMNLTLASYLLQIKLLKGHWIIGYIKTLIGLNLTIFKHFITLNFKNLRIVLNVYFRLLGLCNSIRISSKFYN